MRLIDVDDLIDFIDMGHLRNPLENCFSERDVMCMLESRPTVDAVPVVRCRECKYRGTDDCIFHIKGEPADEELLRKLDNDFCSYGERKEGADNES
jgi:hypothetical protein